MTMRRIISGGQTGSERAALDSAIHFSILSWGGAVPKGRLADDGRLPSVYFPSESRPGFATSGLEETAAGRNHKANSLNARRSDATLILRYRGAGRVLSPGTKLLLGVLDRAGKNYKVTEPATRCVPSVVRWICETRITDESGNEHGIETLNVSGSSEGSSPGIYEDSFKFLEQVFGFVHLFEQYGTRVWASEGDDS